MRRVPVDSSPTNLSRKAPEAHQLDEVVDPRRVGLSDSTTPAGRGGGDVVAHLDVALGAVAIVLRDRQRREDPGVLERPAEAEAGSRSAASRDVLARRGTTAPRRAEKPEIRSKIVVLPAPFGPMSPRISPR